MPTWTEKDCDARGHHAWTWLSDEGPEMVCDDCGIGRCPMCDGRGEVVAQTIAGRMLDSCWTCRGAGGGT